MEVVFSPHMVHVIWRPRYLQSLTVLLLLCRDVQLNPGPRPGPENYPCGFCGQPVTR